MQHSRAKINLCIIDPVGVRAGMDYYNNNLAESLTKKQLNCYIYSNYSHASKQIKVFSASPAGKLVKLLNFCWGFIKAVIHAKRQQVKFVILHSFSSEVKDLYSYLLVKLLGFKIITIAHDISGFASNDSVKIRMLLYNTLSDFIIVHNEYSREQISGFLTSKSLSNTFTIAHGDYLDLPDRSITKADARRALGISNGYKVVLFFGQIKRQKGLDILLESLTTLPDDIHLIIAGKPWKDDFSSYQEQVDRLNLGARVHTYIRYIPDEERELFFKLSDVIVIPYREIYQSGVLLMAMSYGVPLIASDLPANAAIIEDGENGFLFKSGKADSLSEKLNYFFANESIYASRLSANALKTLADKHSWDLVAASYSKFLIN